MCFSASASFGAGVILSTIGVITIKKVESKSQLVFASIPFIFAVQQISEGFLWLALANPKYAFLEGFTSHAFIFFAQVVWPIFVPLGVFLLNKKNKIQKLFLAVGILISLYLAFSLFTYGIKAEIDQHHILYLSKNPIQIWHIGSILYFIATILPLLFSRIKGMKILGLTILLSYIIAFLIYKRHFLSVWCFFASLISVIILVIIIKVNSKTK